MWRGKELCQLHSSKSVLLCMFADFVKDKKALFSYQKFCKFFQISYHIESLDVRMKY